MESSSFPNGWAEVETPHPESGVVAYSQSRYQHPAGYEIVLWSDVEEDASDYSVGSDDEYALEVYDGSGEYVQGQSFETLEQAEEAVREAMNWFPE